MGKKVKKKPTPSPQVLQRAASHVIQKMLFIETDLLEIEKRRNILRKLAAMKG